MWFHRVLQRLQMLRHVQWRKQYEYLSHSRASETILYKGMRGSLFSKLLSMM